MLAALGTRWSKVVEARTLSGEFAITLSIIASARHMKPYSSNSAAALPITVQLSIKRLLDLLISSTGLIVLSPILLGIGIAISLTSAGGPIFRQDRLKRFGGSFRILKFRTMRTQSDQPPVRGSDGSVIQLQVDNRITRIGAFLRQTSLDELPQLWNVLVGEMSLVGPRPDLVDVRSIVERTHPRKLLMRPGITGLAVVRGRNELAWATRLDFDVEYVDRYSLILDLSILTRTIPLLVSRRGVYADADQGPSRTV